MFVSLFPRCRMEDSEKVRRDTGLGPEPSANHAGPDPAALVECGTCGDEVPAKETFALTCDDTHRFCNTCCTIDTFGCTFRGRNGRRFAD